LAKAGKVTFSEQAELDYQELGYTKQQAMECIAWICEAEFRKTLTYSDGVITTVYDDYITQHRGPNGVKDIYVKLKIPKPRTVEQVYVTSFHTQRPNRNE
jgi:hypothetical protein